jgi:hypothetical protein
MIFSDVNPAGIYDPDCKVLKFTVNKLTAWV